FNVVRPVRVGNIGAGTPIRKIAILANRCRRIVKWIPARIVVDAILADEWIQCQESLRTKGMLITETDTEGFGELALILTQLVVGIRNLEPVAGTKEIQV